MSTFAEQQLELAKAGLVISEKMGLPTGSVVLSTGYITGQDMKLNGPQIQNALHDDKIINLVVSINGLNYDLDPAQTEQQIRDALSQLKPLTNIARIEKDDQMAVEIHDKLAKLTEGTSFNKKLLDWVGFDPEVVSGDWKPIDYSMYYLHTSASGIDLGIMAHPNKEHTPEELLHNIIEPNFKERLPEIKKTLADRTIKYVTKGLRENGTPEPEIEAGIAKLREDIDALEITINRDSRGVVFSIRSPEQKKYHEEHQGEDIRIEPDNNDALIATNPLQFQLKSMVTEAEKAENPNASPQLHKALSRAFLYGGGEKAMELFPMVAGRRDMVAALQKEAKKVIAEHPEKAEAFKEIIDSPIFDKQSPFADLEDAGVAPAKAKFYKTPDDPTVKLVMSVEKSKIHETISALASMAGQGQQIAEVPPSAISPENFKQNDGNFIDNLLKTIGLKSDQQNWQAQVANGKNNPVGAMGV